MTCHSSLGFRQVSISGFFWLNPKLPDHRYGFASWVFFGWGWKGFKLLRVGRAPKGREQSHAHTHTRSQMLPHIHPHAQSHNKSRLSLSLSLSHTHTLSHSFSCFKADLKARISSSHWMMTRLCLATIFGIFSSCFGADSDLLRRKKIVQVSKNDLSWLEEKLSV